ncbi:WW domain protein [Ceratobasidium sp. AG-Ba]|nr:WW domain protein [Ceratobasidium sp. AG-Ba]
MTEPSNRNFTRHPLLLESLPGQTKISRSDDRKPPIPPASTSPAPPGPLATQEIDAALTSTNAGRGKEIERSLYTNTRTVEVKQGWMEYRHPLDRRTYFYNEKLKTVTEMYIWDDSMLSQVMSWCNTILALRANVLPGVVVFDVFLQCSSSGACMYYLIDHDDHIIRWLKSNGLSSESMLREEYWTHMENFPIPDKRLSHNQTYLQAALSSRTLDGMAQSVHISTEERDMYLSNLSTATASGNILYRNWSIAT